MALRVHGGNKAATHSWWMLRLTAIALIPLTIWFVVSLIVYMGASYQEVRGWLASPVSAALMIALIAATFYHTYLGLHEVAEDYVHNRPVKQLSILTFKGLCLLLALIGVLSVLKITFGG